MKINAVATEQNQAEPEGRSSSLSVRSIFTWWRLAEKVTLAVSEQCITTLTRIRGGSSCDVSVSAFQVEVLLPPHYGLTHPTRRPIDSLDTRKHLWLYWPATGVMLFDAKAWFYRLTLAGPSNWYPSVAYSVHHGFLGVRESRILAVLRRPRRHDTHPKS